MSLYLGAVASAGKSYRVLQRACIKELSISCVAEAPPCMEE